MYIYNITTNVSENIHLEWLNWMKQIHIPEMLNTGKFTKATMIQVLVDEEMGGLTYAVQYTTDSLQTLEEYYNSDASKFIQETKKRFGDKVVTFATELKVIDEQFCIAVRN